VHSNVDAALIFELFLILVGAPALLMALYLLLAALLSARPSAPADLPPTRRFRCIIPAHNEAAGIADTINSLRALDYPAELFEIVVVADNCQDDTAARARAAGATVLERVDAERRGKGYALDHAFAATPASVDAVVVIDADTVVSPNLLRAFAARRAAGAEAIQADYAVRNPNAGWRTRLMAIALGAFHIVRSRARERLELSCGLRGNGMCFSTALLRNVPHSAYSVVEDVEYGIRLGEAGRRVAYADEAHVYGEMVTTAAAARSQRKRWEEGRAALVRQHGLRLLERGLRTKSLMLFDLGIDLVVPPLSKIVLTNCLGLALGLALAAYAGRAGPSVWAFGGALLAIALYVLRGWMVSSTGFRGLLDLTLAPAYVLWKLTLRIRSRAPESWVRTRREKAG
jgi:cellulose synthase/poly-beta-1,6-N-acetylglucosamine synthase-like glycosyltransferase